MNELPEGTKPVRYAGNLARAKRCLEAFTPFEHAVLSDLFKVSRPRFARGIDIPSGCR